ncbi:MAG: hypothetical protein FWF96_04550 [Kiritimatiellaeota bacterium]|nr:hypothetical protein [Kiritimatiellota bacterium]
MLLCFGASWPFSIAKTLRTKQVRGKSPVFMGLILAGYASGITHKLLNPPPPGTPGLAAHVVWLYALNLLLVALDFGLYVKYKKTA